MTLFINAQTDSDPKEVYFNLYGIHCDPSSSFQWERVAGKCVNRCMYLSSSCGNCRGLAPTYIEVHSLSPHTHKVSVPVLTVSIDITIS